VLSDGRPFLEPPVDVGSLDGEETTQETDEALVGGSPASRANMESSDGGTAERSPLDGRSEAAASDEAPDEKTVKEITERLAAAAAKTRELRGRLELAEATEAALRESLERERRRIDRESTRAEQHGAVAERLEKEAAARRGDGFWRGLFGG
jgi:TolA-binding protein